MIRLSPVFRISLGLVLLTISILLAGNLLGLTPDLSQAKLDSRQRFCESLAVQLSLALNSNNVSLVKNTILAVSERDPDLLSAAVRKNDGAIVVQTRDHHRHWSNVRADSSSTPTHVQVPVFQGGARWGTVEISFLPLNGNGIVGLLKRPFVRLLLFVAASGFLVYYLLIRKALKHLDPSSVIPGRVKAAMDALSEGVVLMDDGGRIVMVNAAFAKRAGAPASDLMGTYLSKLVWTHPKSGKAVKQLPWANTINTGDSRTGVPMCLTNKQGEVRTMMVNSTPIHDGNDKLRGTLTTFDDVTQLEQNNVQLEEMLHMLQESRDQVHQQNAQLQILASHDSLTNCLNRRALFNEIDKAFEDALRSGDPLCCMMCDIDHFKQINDQHGHIMGDSAIREVSAALKSVIRDKDVIGRYGGEEFCILMQDTNREKAAQSAERLRARISALVVGDIRVTASFGLAFTEPGIADPKELLQRADAALYQAKDEGRNCVVIWQKTDYPETVK